MCTSYYLEDSKAMRDITRAAARHKLQARMKAVPKAAIVIPAG